MEGGATHVGVATITLSNHFETGFGRNIKRERASSRRCLSKFYSTEEALASRGVVVWPMTGLEADDALASAHLASADPRVLKVCILTPDKDLAQCVRDDRVVQVDNRAGAIRDANAVLKKFGVSPILIPDYLALVGDSADGYPGISGIGKSGAARLVNQYGPIEAFPKKLLTGQREQALLFKRLATLRTDAALFTDVDQLRLRGTTPAFAELTTKMGEPGLLARANALAAKLNCAM